MRKPLDNSTDPYYPATALMDQAALGAVTREPSHCAEALNGTWAIVNASGLWSNTSARGLTRAYYSRAVAVAYDMCAPSWPAWASATLSTALLANGYSLMSVFDGVNGLGNNHEAVRYGSAGLCFAACDDQPACAERAANAYDYVLASLTANLGRPSLGDSRRGVNPEGEGYTAYPALFSFPFAAAVRRFWGVDLAADLPPAAVTHVWRYISAVPLPRPLGPDNAVLVNGLHPDFTDDNPYVTLSGSLAQAFHWAPPALVGGMRAIYDASWGSAGDGSFEAHRSGALFAYLYYPDDVAPADPDAALGLTFFDPSYAFVSMRSGWGAGPAASLVQLSGKARPCYQCHQASDAASLRIFAEGFPWAVGAGRTTRAQGQTTTFPVDPLAFDAPTKDAGGMASAPALDPSRGNGTAAVFGSSTGVAGAVRRIAVSFDAASLKGASASVVVADSSANASAVFWRLNAPQFIDAAVVPTAALPAGAIAAFELRPAAEALRDPAVAAALGPLSAGAGAPSLRGVLLYAGGAAAGDVTGRVGQVPRGTPGDPHSGGYGFGSRVYRNNTWTDFAVAGGARGCDGWVWALTVAAAGASHPVVSTEAAAGGGCCDGRVVRVGALSYRIGADGIAAL